MRYADSNCTHTEVYQPKHGYRFTGPCLITGNQYSVFVPARELFAHRSGALIQDAMPSVSAGDREFLMTGMSPDGWNQAFPNEDAEEMDHTAAEIGGES